ncbi:isoprenylcysteine carboxylmethyltransferase family protein [Marixanthomonas ophiurae]|uniref:Isoprenylcysteine carboxylmethyltransferase family protein n=1 Tax=Marixanthomonas ophiurae TaxID=387659 RepID=A0A3E1Q6P6_9FLAO|nr:isoprenylcysteine carboxylmethyltransferase family protein [Marixanthomonas ophiurae]
MLKKEVLFLIIQFVLFSFYFIDIEVISYSIPSWLNYILLSLVGCGFVIIFLGILNLNDDLSVIHAKKEKPMVFHGIYRYVRHPIYSGILLSMIAYALFTASIFKFILTLIMGVVFYYKSDNEENWMVEKYEQYRIYKKKTGRFLPKLRNKNY